MRLLACQHRDGVRAGEALHRRAHCFREVAAVEAMHEVRDDLGIGLAFEAVPRRLQLGAQLFVVFDDAVVHQRDFPVRDEGVRVLGRRRPVRRPARVGDTRRASKVFFANLNCQVCDARDAAHAPDLAVENHGYAAGVVAAVLEPAQAFDEDRDDVAPRRRTDDAAHGLSLSFAAVSRTGPTRQRAPSSASWRCAKASPSVRAPTLTFFSTQCGPPRTWSPRLTRPSNTQLTSIETSRPHSSAPRTSMRAGSASVTPASSSRLASRPWQTRSSTASSCMELTPATSHGSSTLTATTGTASATASATRSVR